MTDRDHRWEQPPFLRDASIAQPN